MDKIKYILRNYWQLLLVSIALIIPTAFGMMVGIWIIGSLTQSIWIGLIISVSISAFIVTLPIGWICLRSIDVLGKGMAYALGGTSFFICFLLLIGTGCTVVVR